ncbi:hypothetical protein ACFW2Y_06065 [Streptomyces sp. NPDC058877]|uniref:hypothetical protein n=1 Tax=unclassified Streptomyces TaxID=2593676 RepID=UPI003683763F
MTAAVFALGIGAVTASGCVWYVPALVDLRAGADRPASRRLAATACVTGWATAAVTALLLLAGAPGPLVLAGVVAGAAASVTVRVGAAVRRRREEREDAVCWAALAPTPPRASPRPEPYAFARRTVAALAAAVVLALLLITPVRAGTAEERAERPCPMGPDAGGPAVPDCAGAGAEPRQARQ